MKMENNLIPNDLPLENSPTSREALMKRVTKRLLRYALKRTGTKLILILGHLRSGKSSLFESLTGATGHSKKGIDSVTKEYQIGAANINGKLYLFVDTPGLKDPSISNADILREIAKLLDTTKDSVTYAGVLYVHPATLQFSDEAKKSLLFLNAFCGPSYSPSITFVTTMWDRISPDEIEEQDELVNEMARAKWSSFLDRGANLYHHGRAYEGDTATLEVLSLRKKPEVRQKYAREAISRLYPLDKNHAAPLIIQELRVNTLLEDTTAGKLLGMIGLQIPTDDAQQNDTSQNPVQQSRPEGFDWFHAIVAAIKFPLDQITAFLAALWNLVAALKSAILALMPSSTITVSVPRFTGYSVEVLFTLPGGLRFIVGYGLRGPYLRPWSSQAANFASEIDSEDDNVDGPDMPVSITLDPEVTEQEETFGMDGPDVRPEYLAVSTAFERVLSVQEGYLPANQENHVQTDTEESDSWWWERCAMM
ncbi:hypothetical protein N7539_006008 [Penicillium diatomitis]|uniref:AIG1-type G domain-containing protein n=1 Tax=Penicillium diatomitis TaxID=2819901 RepID=A0A9W9X4X7_9EURO|nr:uncharacterized protein N7539_006008 [Penicillium diatomitis]KAJ5483808.1 hypothetical protein N7539_006008 [Penicillium diatomitis]